LGRVRVDGRAFFRPGAGERLTALCIDLGLIFKTDPVPFLNMDSDTVETLYAATVKRLEDYNDPSQEE